MILRISSHYLCWLLGSADRMHNTTQQFCGLESGGGAAILVLLRFEVAPSTFESAQPMNSKGYDPFFRGICHTSQIIRRFVPLRDANARGFLLDS